MTIRRYPSAEAFKQALEQRLRTSVRSGPELARKRQLLVFDRFLARVVAVLGDAATRVRRPPLPRRMQAGWQGLRATLRGRRRVR